MMTNKTFFETQLEIFGLFNNENYEELLIKINEAKIRFPERLDKMAFWEACVYSITGNKKNAIASLGNAIDQGVWWNPVNLTRDLDLKNIQNETAFKQILVTCEEKLKTASVDSKHSLSIYGNRRINYWNFFITLERFKRT